MKIEILIKNDDQLKYANEIMFEDIDKTIVQIPNKKMYIFTLQKQNEDESTAKLLSKVYEEMLKHHEFQILSNESSEYFLNKLFPLVINFELKLRKLLNLASNIDNEEKLLKVKDYIKDVEKMSLGQLLEFLFTDIEFNKNIKKVFNSNNPTAITRNITKDRYIQHISGYVEETPWSQLFGNRVNILVEKYIDIIDARNDVAHAHQFNAAKFNKIKTLFKNTLKQLDDEIEFLETKKKSDILVENFNFTFKNLYNSYFEFNQIILKSELLDYFNNIVNGLEEFGTRVTYSRGLRVLDDMTNIVLNLPEQEVQEKDTFKVEENNLDESKE